MTQVGKVLKCIQDVGLTVKEKCKVGIAEVIYLGQ